MFFQFICFELFIQHDSMTKEIPLFIIQSTPLSAVSQILYCRSWYSSDGGYGGVQNKVELIE